MASSASISSSPTNEPSLVLGIVGGGFSGTLALANLVRRTDKPLIVEWFDDNRALATGVAYSTVDNSHLLNVRAHNMGAFSEDPRGFYSWLQSSEGKNKSEELWPNQAISEDTFAPRVLYAAYLKSILLESLKIAEQKGIVVRIHSVSVVNAHYNNTTQKLLITGEKLGSATKVQVDALVLATGISPPPAMNITAHSTNDPHLSLINGWHVGLKDIALSTLSSQDTVVIIGTGLTAVDSVLTLQKKGFEGTIVAISRHGWLSASHATFRPYPAWGWTRRPDQAPKTALGLFRALRSEVKRAQDSGYDWRSVIDSLRPVTQTLWKQLTLIEKRRFMRHLFTLWNTHRHRMAPEICETLDTLQSRGRLKIIKGHIKEMKADHQGYIISYRGRGTSETSLIHPKLVLNCTGPGFNILTTTNSFLRNLINQNLLRVDQLGMGFITTEAGWADGIAPETIYPLGPLRVSELLESIAVPELRHQAHACVELLMKRLHKTA